MTSKALWTGRILSAIVILFLLMDGVMKLMKAQPVLEAFAKLGYPATAIVPIGILLVVCTLLYAIPKTAVLGAMLLTGYLGGAVATHVRASDQLFSHVLFPVYLGLFLWGGLWLRDNRVRVLVP